MFKVKEINMVLSNVEGFVNSIDSINAEYILADNRFISELDSAVRYAAKNEYNMASFMIEKLTKISSEYDNRTLTPANTKVGDGVTIHLYSDAHAATVVKITKSMVVVRQDKATIDPNFKPEFVVGGFAGHCTNQRDQTYTYETNPNGQEYTFRWSKKYQQYRNGQTGLKLTKGRREFYDYNF